MIKLTVKLVMVLILQFLLVSAAKADQEDRLTSTPELRYYLELPQPAAHLFKVDLGSQLHFLGWNDRYGFQLTSGGSFPNWPWFWGGNDYLTELFGLLLSDRRSSLELTIGLYGDRTNLYRKGSSRPMIIVTGLSIKF